MGRADHTHALSHTCKIHVLQADTHRHVVYLCIYTTHTHMYVYIYIIFINFFLAFFVCLFLRIVNMVKYVTQDLLPLLGNLCRYLACNKILKLKGQGLMCETTTRESLTILKFSSLILADENSDKNEKAYVIFSVIIFKSH